MKRTSWGLLALIGSLAFLLLYLKDRQIRAGVDRLHHIHLQPQSALPDLKLPSQALIDFVHVQDVDKRATHGSK